MSRLYIVTLLYLTYMQSEWVNIAQSCQTLCDPMDYAVHGIFQARILEWVALPLLQGIFPTQELNSGLQHCRQILCQLSHKGSQRTLEWVAYPFSRGSSWPRNQTRVSCVAGGFFTNWAMREALACYDPKDVGNLISVPLPFVNPAWWSASSRFQYCWSLAWRILSITLLACDMTAIVY